jgi:hypothetical protein
LNSTNAIDGVALIGDGAAFLPPDQICNDGCVGIGLRAGLAFVSIAPRCDRRDSPTVVCNIGDDVDADALPRKRLACARARMAR